MTLSLLARPCLPSNLFDGDGDGEGEGEGEEEEPCPGGGGGGWWGTSTDL